MSGIFSGLENIWNGILTIVNGIKLGIEFLINLLKSILELFKLIMTISGNITSIILTLPPWLIAFATASVSVAILYIILGRETGK